MKKIFVRRDESVAELVEKIVSAEDTDVILVLPRGSGVGEAVSNFDTIKREAEGAQKKIFIESVDEDVLALAKSLHIEALHPLFGGARKQVLSDIVPVMDDGLGAFFLKKESKKTRKQKKESVVRDSEKTEGEPHIHSVPKIAKIKSGVARAHKVQLPKDEDTEDEAEEVYSDAAPGMRRKFTGAVVVLALILLLWGSVWFVNTFFGTATINLQFKKTSWEYIHSFVADTSVATTSTIVKNYTLPGQLFTSPINYVLPSPASGMKMVSEKATGIITIHNGYSSAAQPLVAGTRFQTPDGKIFRLTNQVLVPGAEIQDGKIVSSSLQAAIVADAPGPAYNLGPISRLTIPGFKGSPKYDVFYGELARATTGGFVGNKAVPTAADIQQGKDKMVAILQTTLESNLRARYPDDLVWLDAARKFKISKLTVNENTTNGNFSVFGEASASIIGFREQDLRSFLNSVAISGDNNFILNDIHIRYSSVAVSSAGDRLTFAASASGTLTTNFSPDDFRAKVADHTVDEARFMVSQLPGLTEGKISVWPAWPGFFRSLLPWLDHTPSDRNRIHVSIN